jgi:thiol-disulfide isomerase/thioredoxin
MPDPASTSRHLLATALLFVASTLITGCNGATEPTTASPSAPPATTTDDKQPAASVSVEIKSWKDVQALIAAQKGKVVVVDLWSTSCVPCMREFPNLVALHNKYPSEKITCISVSCDYEGLEEEPPESKKPAVIKFLESTKATCTNLLLSDADVDVYESIKLASIPAVYVYDTQGKMAKRFDNDAGDYGDEGFTYEDHIIPLIEKLMAGDTPAPESDPK